MLLKLLNQLLLFWRLLEGRGESPNSTATRLQRKIDRNEMKVYRRGISSRIGGSTRIGVSARWIEAESR